MEKNLTENKLETIRKASIQTSLWEIEKEDWVGWEEKQSRWILWPWGGASEEVSPVDSRVIQAL